MTQRDDRPLDARGVRLGPARRTHYSDDSAHRVAS
jgi:hypothetical protein